MTTTKKPAKKRPPRQVWIVFDKHGASGCSYTTRRTALAGGLSAEDGEFVAGPYVLAERTGQR